MGAEAYSGQTCAVCLYNVNLIQCYYVARYYELRALAPMICYRIAIRVGPAPAAPRASLARPEVAAYYTYLVLALTIAHPPVSLYFEQFIIYYLVVVGVRPPFAVGLQDLVNERRPAGPHILQQMQMYAYGCDNQIVCLLSGSALNAQ